MFKNIGKKIKSFAIVCFALGVVSDVVFTAIFLNDVHAEFVELMPLYIIIIAAGILVAWIGAMFVYGFGQLIDNSDKIVSELKKQENPKASENEDFTNLDIFTPLN